MFVCVCVCVGGGVSVCVYYYQYFSGQESILHIMMSRFLILIVFDKAMLN